MAKRDYYEILGVGRDADEAALKKAYRKVAMQYHPDRNQGNKDAEEKFKEAAEAYEVLTDADKRARYDRFGHAGVENMGGGGGGFSGGGMNMEDIFAQFGDIFGDGGSPFDSFFGGGGGGRAQGRSQGQKGSNLRVKLSLNLAEIANGVTKKIKVKKQISCTTCNGSGAKDKNAITTCGTCKGSGYVRQVKQTFLGTMQTTTACPTCHGSGQSISAFCSSCKGEGRIMGEETIELNIPAGVEDGMQLSLRGKGNAGMRGGPNGDLLITIEEEPHESLHREGNNIIFDLYINFADAALGTTCEVPTIDGLVKIKVPAGTQSGKIFRLKDKGLPGVQSHGRGDQLVHVNVWTPKKLTDEEKRLMEQIKAMPNFEPQPGKGERTFFDRMRDYFQG
ncbi:MAG: molecular chaperone DnaJ [Saprospiraceae bacterium]|jgi:molecular chaperone DnaJ|nr:molecular chaperone DnaJ [Saprospiraceae bacterium]